MMGESKKPGIEELEEKLRQKEKIIKVLTRRVEREISAQGSEYDSFLSAAVLEKKVRARTEALESALHRLEEKNFAIDQSRRFYEDLLNNLQDLVSILNPEGKVVFANNPALEHANLSLEDVADKYLWETHWFDFPQADIEAIKESIALARKGSQSTHDLQARFHDQLLWIRYKAAPIFDAEGNLESIIAEGFLIHDQKLAEQALRLEKERIQVTLESIGDGVITTGRDGLVDYMNPVAEWLTGWSEEEAIGQNLEAVFNIFDEQTGEKVASSAVKCMEEIRVIGLEGETGLKQLSGKSISIEDSSAPIRNESGEILGAVLVFRDVTETRIMARDLEYHACHDALTGLVNRR